MEIKLFNRDGADLKMVSKDRKLWELKVDDAHKYILEYMRCGLMDDGKTIDMIDPSGGPYLAIGNRLNDKYVIDAFIEMDSKLYIHTNKI